LLKILFAGQSSWINSYKSTIPVDFDQQNETFNYASIKFRGYVSAVVANGSHYAGGSQPGVQEASVPMTGNYCHAAFFAMECRQKFDSSFK